ncbi:M48 family metallopeptidase [Paraglaciecola sp. L3A3]|uniref:M48 family metallopeptidase n=1 Tax=Paraglaciecola sp. L3A3 TaxID=2686358 RepID=UPI00131ADE10|nr:M48 family metallopeptidase [Paraglaciecola sp. L3A3]
MQVQGQFYPEGGSQCLLAEVTFSQSGAMSLTVTDNNIHIQLRRDELKIKDKLGSIPREIVLSGLGLLSVESTAETDSWLGADKKSNRIAKIEKNRSMVLLSLILVPAFLYVFFKHMIPGFAVHFSEYVPEGAIRIASEHTLYSLDKTLLNKSKVDAKLQQTYRDNWQQTLSQLTLNDVQYNLNFRESDKMGANAFALPDGTVVVTDELLSLIDNNEELLQAILLHEIGHVENRHSMRLIAETLATSLAIDYFFGDLGGMIEVFAGLSNTLVQNQFSQKLEWEADNFALEQIETLGLDPESFAKAMEKLAATLPEESKLDALMQSHPLMKERIDNARARK